MADIQKERDWDKEVAEVDRLLKKLPAAHPTLGRGNGEVAEPTFRRRPLTPGNGPLGCRFGAKGRKNLQRHEEDAPNDEHL